MNIRSLLLVALTLTTVSSASADLRIATVDVARVINEVPDAVAKKEELDSASEKAKSKLEAKGKELQALKEKLEKAKVAPDSKEAENFRNQARDFERMRADAKAELERKFLKMNKDISEEVMTAISKYAKSHDYDLVLDKSEKFRGPVLFGDSSADITDDIIKMLK